MTTIMRYEAHLHRLNIQTMHELEALQNRRKGGQSPLARLDIIGAPAFDAVAAVETTRWVVSAAPARAPTPGKRRYPESAYPFRRRQSVVNRAES